MSLRNFHSNRRTTSTTGGEREGGRGGEGRGEGRGRGGEGRGGEGRGGEGREGREKVQYGLHTCVMCSTCLYNYVHCMYVSDLL